MLIGSCVLSMIICMILCYYIAKANNRGTTTALVCGLLFTYIAVIVYIIIGRKSVKVNY